MYKTCMGAGAAGWTLGLGKTGESLFQRATLGGLLLKSHRISKLEVLLLKNLEA